MTDRFSDLFEEARDSGKVDETWLERFQTTFEASPLRQEIKATKDENKTLREQSKTLRTGLLKDRFSTLGIKISPDVLNIPDDLNPADPEGVKTWAVSMGLVEDAPTTDPATRATHDRIANASNEGGNTQIPSLEDLDPTKMSEDEFYRKAAAREAAIKSSR